jgi:hypothetical protein
MKKILIISYIAKPTNIVNTRTIHISDSLNQLGEYTIDYVTSDYGTLPDYVNNIFYLKRSRLRQSLDAFHIKFSNLIKSKKVLKKVKYNPKMGYFPIFSETKVLRSIYDFYFDYIIEPFLNRSLKLKDYDYDLVISSYNPWTNHSVAKKIVKRIKKNKNSFWVQDYRDPVIQSSTPVFLRPILSFILKNMTKNCDLITYVTPFENNQLGFHENTSSYLLENAYANFENGPLTSEELKEYHLDNKKLKLIYAGTLYPGRSDLTPIFDAIEFLINQNQLLADQISFYYFGNNRDYFDSTYKVNKSFEVLAFDKIDRDKIFSVYNHMDIIVTSAWVFKKFPLEGDPSGKVYELLNLNKTLIGIVKKDKGATKSYMSKLFTRNDKAFCFEISNEFEHEVAVSEIMSLILTVHANRHTSLDVNGFNKDVKDLTWLEITRRFIEHLNSVKSQEEN